MKEQRDKAALKEWVIRTCPVSRDEGDTGSGVNPESQPREV